MNKKCETCIVKTMCDEPCKQVEYNFDDESIEFYDRLVEKIKAYNLFISKSLYSNKESYKESFDEIVGEINEVAESYFNAKFKSREYKLHKIGPESGNMYPVFTKSLSENCNISYNPCLGYDKYDKVGEAPETMVFLDNGKYILYHGDLTNEVESLFLDKGVDGLMDFNQLEYKVARLIDDE